MNLVSASDPVWANAEGTAVNLMVRFDTFPTPMPFTALSTDYVQYGRDIYTRAVAGEFGVIAPFVPPPPPPLSVPVSPNGQNAPQVIQ